MIWRPFTLNLLRDHVVKEFGNGFSNAVGLKASAEFRNFSVLIVET